MAVKVGAEPAGWMAWARCACLTGEADGADVSDADGSVGRDLSDLGRSGSRKATRVQSGVFGSSFGYPAEATEAEIEQLEAQLEDELEECARKLRSMPRFMFGIRRFQRRIAERALQQGPNVEETARGVRIEPVYDFFDPAVRTVRLRKMDAHLVHRRKRARGAFRASTEEELLSEAKSDDDFVEEDPGGSMSKVPSTSSAGSSSAGSEMAERARAVQKTSSAGSERAAARGMQKTSSVASQSSLAPPGGAKGVDCASASTHSSHEIIAHWGVVTGKLIRSRVIDLRQATAKTTAASKKAKPIQCLRSVRQRAVKVIDEAVKLAKKIGRSEDELDGDWSEQGLLKRLFGDKGATDTLMLLAQAAGKIAAVQPSMVSVEAPVRVFGDLHGQLRDLLLILFAFGLPSSKKLDQKLVFNGDFVDRGAHQLCVVGLLFALKVAFPNDVVLVRGNHEDKTMNEKYGFFTECVAELGQDWGKKVFNLIQGTFNHLPLACLIGEKILCVHGGIGHGKWSLQDLLEVRRPLNDQRMQVEENRWLLGLLWSDPIEDGHGKAKVGEEVFGVHPSPRGKLATQFGWNVTKTFCARNGLSLIVRSHQSKRNGAGFEVMHENLLMRVFSARDYEGHGNDGSVLLVRDAPGDPGHLIVRAQCVRSATKARRQAARRNLEAGARQ